MENNLTVRSQHKTEKHIVKTYGSMEERVKKAHFRN